MTTKVFIASSSEMRHERLVLINLLMDMSDGRREYDSVVWETMDSAMRIGRKEDEYLRKMRQCEVCITLFWRTLGRYTKEELQDALSEQRSGGRLQKVFVLQKNDGSPMSPELEEYIGSLKEGDCCPIMTFGNDDELRKLVEKLVI